MSKELLPCPFCGGEPYIEPHRGTYVNGYFVSCNNCACESRVDTKESVITTWNTRPDPVRKNDE